MSNDQPTELKTHQPPASLVAAARVSGMAAYQALVDESERDFEGYWARLAREFVSWKTPFTKVLDSSQAPFFKWFEDGTLNASYNCLDRDAEQVELVDMTPEALRRRMAHGHIYAHDKVDAALSNYFRPGNLGALRELALLWLADKVDEAMRRYLRDERIVGTWETRERVVVAITGAPSGDHLIRRAARMARRSHGDLIGVHIRPGTGLREGPDEALFAHRALLADLGGTYHETTSDDVAEGLVAFAESVRATQIVLGASHRDRLSELVRGSVINRVIRAAGEIDVHVISRDGVVERAPLPAAHRRRRSRLSRRRRVAGWALVVVGLPLLTVVLDAARNSIGLPSVLVIYLLYVCVVAAVGGFGPALVTALASTAAANWYFTQPLYTLRIKDPEHLIAVAAFVRWRACSS